MATKARTTLLFDFTTNPTDRVRASAHSGGWSETHWSATFSANDSFIEDLANARAGCLASTATIIGWRYEEFTLAGNKLLPQGSTTGRFTKPGAQQSINLPQDALMLSGKTAGAPNANHFSIRGLPDDQIVNGEYQPQPAFRDALTLYTNRLVAGQWGFMGRVKTNTTARVMQIAGAVITLSANVGGGNNDFLRLLRVFDQNGNPVKGAFPIDSVAGAVYTMQRSVGATVLDASGTARLDQINYFGYSRIDVQRAVSRKVGRPFEVYRGRASRRR